MTETAADPHTHEHALSRGAHLLASAAAVVVFAAAAGVIGYFGWFVVRSVWSDEPDSASVAFASAVVLCVVGCLVVAVSSLASALCKLEVLRADPRLLHGLWSIGALFAVIGLAVFVGLGVVMAALSQLPASGKAFVIVVFAACAAVPLAPGYDIWRRRKG